ncbi:LCP family protein [Schaalia vaccimaxillae]|uniref:LCP family protein n=1 Tax=Schaalia vaccimaxillae TaxID=183916 RepID=UPI0003B32123|nr:LCP family protein [Schaalia vaccimaxillae]
MSDLPTRAEVQADRASGEANGGRAGAGGGGRAGGRGGAGRDGNQPPKRMSGTKKALIVLCSLLLVLVLAVAGIFLSIRHSINSQIQHVQITPSGQSSSSSAQSIPVGNDINFLVLGSDSRQSGGDPTDWEAGAQRSDVMMLVQITGDRKGINIMSIPRDSWVEIPGYGNAKINAAYSYGGADLTIETVQNLTGVHIDHFMVTDFTSFEQLTDILGGVTIASAEGVKTYSGSEALAFVRERKGLARGDFDRVRRQQAWMRAIMQKTFDQDVLTDVSKMSEMLTALLSHSAVDQNLTFDSMLSLASEMTTIRSNSVNFFTAPFTGTGMSEDGQSIVNLDSEALASLMEAWRSDEVDTYLIQHSGVIDVLGASPVA